MHTHVHVHVQNIICTCIQTTLYNVDAGGDQRAAGKGKRQAWTAAATEAFFEGLYQVHDRRIQLPVYYSGTSELRTPRDLAEVSIIGKVSFI